MSMKCGIEIHQQLKTKKLFCDCESRLSENVTGTVTRILKPTRSEMGKTDRAAMDESIKKRKFIYEITDNSCLVELDEEPPHELNREALEVALQIALMLHANIIDEVHIMRKVVIDGSNTSGFQRTALIAVNGYIETSSGKVKIPTICLEEEAARKIEDHGDNVIYRLDRLGIPLIEIATAPDMKTGEEVKEVAQRIGYILRVTKKVRRGAGTIRQDINISTGEGRVEIKGASKLNMIPKWVKQEIHRQESLKDIRKILLSRNAHVDTKIMDITPILKDTNSRIILRELNRGGKVLAIRLRGFAGLLKSEKYRLGRELATRVRVIGIKGLFHSDELPNYGITAEEVEKIKKHMKIENSDAFVLIAGQEEKAHLAMEKVIDRAKMAMVSVPEETRAPLNDGTSSYLRPLPGAERMYPETDIPPIRITDEYVNKLKNTLPKMPEERVNELVSLGIAEQDAWQILHREMDEKYEYLTKKYGFPTIIARAMLSGCEGIDYEYIFSELKSGKFAKEAVDDIVQKACAGKDIDDLISEYQFSVDIDDIITRLLNEKIKFVHERGMDAFKPLMGLVMKEARGKVDGRIVSEKLKNKLEKILKRKN